MRIWRPDVPVAMKLPSGAQARVRTILEEDILGGTSGNEVVFWRLKKVEIVEDFGGWNRVIVGTAMVRSMIYAQWIERHKCCKSIAIILLAIALRFALRLEINVLSALVRP